VLVEIDRLLGDAADHDAIAEHVEHQDIELARVSQEVTERFYNLFRSRGLRRWSLGVAHASLLRHRLLGRWRPHIVGSRAGAADRQARALLGSLLSLLVFRVTTATSKPTCLRRRLQHTQ
jgi:hypothetical protein